MRQQHVTRPRTFALRLALGAAALLCAQLGVYLLILQDTVGGVSVLRAAPARDPSMTLDLQVVLLRSDASAAQWSVEAYEQRLAAWTEALRGLGLPYRVVGEPALPGALRSASVLVLPGATCLGEPTRQAVRGFLDRGRGVVATGPVGARNADCSWRGWGFLSELTGAERVEAVTLPGAVFAAFRGGEFSEGAVPAGYRLELPYQELVLIDTKRPAVQASDWRLRPARGERVEASGLGTHHEHGAGRVVWLGFDESGAGRHQAPQHVLHAYLAAGAAWAARQPIASVATWPGRRPAAATVIVVAGEREDRLAALARVLREAGIAGTYVARSDMARIDPGWGGELATSGDGDDPFAGQPASVQRRRLTTARTALETAGPRRVGGFLPPAGATDTGTIRAVAATGLSYTLGEVSGLRATPERVEVPSPFLAVLPGRPVIRLFQVAADDQEVLARPGDPATFLLRDLDRVMWLGGLYPLTLHSDLAGGDELLPAVRSVLAEASRRGAWLAPASEIARWWVAREGLHVAAKRLSPYRIQVDLGNHGQEHARDVVVSVHLPYVPKTVALRSPVLRLTPPATEREGDVLRVHFADVAPQSNHTYVISLDE
jgi:hypothetical protein